MGYHIQYRKLYICDSESDRELDWGEDSLIYCKDVTTYYKIYDGGYVEVPLDELFFVSLITIDKLAISGVPDEGKFLRYDGSWAIPDGTGSVNALFSLLGIWKIDTGTNTSPVTSGRIAYDEVVQIDATELYISHLTDDNIDVDIILDLLAVDNVLTIQDKSDSANYQIYTISGTPSFASATWTIPVTYQSSGGTGATGFADNHQIFIGSFGAGGTGGSGHEIQEGGTPLATEPALNFNGDDFDLTDTPGVSTNVRIASGIRDKLGYITVTQAVDLDAIESRVSELDAAVVLKGGWDASGGTFPGGGVAQAGWSYQVTVGGTVDGIQFSINDRIIALLDNASTTVYATNWLKADYSDLITSLDGQTGALTLGAVINTLTAKTTPVDNDLVVISDSADSNASKKVTLTNLWLNYLKGKADAVYQAILTATNFNAFVNSLSSKSGAALVDNDAVPIYDSDLLAVAKKVTFTSLKLFFKNYFDTIYLNSLTATTTYIAKAGGTSPSSSSGVMTGSFNEADFNDIASAATTDIASAAGNYGNITGTTTITSFGSSAPGGARRTVRFADSLTITHNATNLILPGSANIVTQAGDIAEFVALPVAGRWQCVFYQRADGSVLYPYAPIANPTFTGTVSGITKSMVGLGNVDNTSDVNKPISTATQTALDLKAPLASPIFTGTATLPKVVVDGSPDSNESANGMTTNSFNCGENITKFELVYYKSDGKWWRADADSVATSSGMLGIALETVTANNPISVALAGSFVRYDTWNWTIGAKLFASSTIGGITETPPTGTDTVTRIIGYAVTADIVYFLPMGSYIVHA